MSFKGTTILCAKREGQMVIGGDGQVTLGQVVMKGNARKVRRLYHGEVIAGFAGATADAFTLFERFEGRLQTHNGQLMRAAVEMAKDWRTDRALRKLEAMMIVADRDNMLLISGTGDVIEPQEDFIAIGSGGSYAHAAAQALMHHTTLSAKEVVQQALTIAADLCIYTNHHFTIEVIEK